MASDVIDFWSGFDFFGPITDDDDDENPGASSAHLGVATGSSTSAKSKLFLSSDAGGVWGWGANNNNQIVRADQADEDVIPAPRMISSLAGIQVVKIACGRSHSACLTNEAQVLTWGNGAMGKLGHASSSSVGEPTLVASFEGMDVMDIACGMEHTVALVNSQVYTWGCGYNGRLGHGNISHKLEPTIVEALENFKITSIAAGGANTMVTTDIKKPDSFRFVWGCGSNGQLGTGTKMDASLPVSLILQDDTKFTKISIGEKHMAAIVGYSLHIWGCNESYQCGVADKRDISKPFAPRLGVPLYPRAVGVACGATHTIAIVDDHVVAAGTGFVGQLGLGNKATEAKTFTKVMPYTLRSEVGKVRGSNIVACGEFHSVVVMAGKVYTWGDNRYGHLGLLGVDPHRHMGPDYYNLLMDSADDSETGLALSSVATKSVSVPSEIIWTPVHMRHFISPVSIVSGGSSSSLHNLAIIHHDDVGIQAVLDSNPSAVDALLSTALQQDSNIQQEQQKQHQSNEDNNDNGGGDDADIPVNDDDDDDGGGGDGGGDGSQGLGKGKRSTKKVVIDDSSTSNNIHVHVGRLVDMLEVSHYVYPTTNFTSNVYHLAVYRNNPEVIKKLADIMDTKSKDPSLFEGIMTLSPLHVACMLGYTQCVDALIRAGAPINALTGLTQRSPLHLAVIYGGKYLVKRIAMTPGLLPLQRDSLKRTAFDYASLEQSYDLKNYLKLYDIVIVFDPSDRDFARSLSLSLAKYHIVCSYAELDVNNDDDKERIRSVRAILFVVSGTSSSSKDCLELLQFAHNNEKPIYSVWKEKARFSSVLETLIFRRQLVDLTDKAKFREGIASLVAGLRNVLVEKSSTGEDADDAGQDQDDEEVALYSNPDLDDKDAPTVATIKANPALRFIFVCYDPADRIRARRLRKQLNERGFLCSPLSVYDDQAIVADYIHHCWALVLALSRRAARTQVIKDQLALAENRQKLILPVVIQKDIKVPLDAALEYTLSRAPLFHMFSFNNGSLPGLDYADRLAFTIRMTKEADEKAQTMRKLNTALRDTKASLSQKKLELQQIQDRIAVIQSKKDRMRQGQ